MARIYLFELRRLLVNRMFFGILAVLLTYGWLTLSGTIILGIADTAPFSPWSFGFYLSRMLPILCLGEMLMANFYVSPEERRARPVLAASPVHPGKLAAVRGAAILTGSVILGASAAMLAVGFLVSLFGAQTYEGLMPATVITLAPPIVLCLGTGVAITRFQNRILAYVLTGVLVLWAALPLPAKLSLSLGQFFLEYPAMLDGLDPVFSVPSSDILISRLMLAAAGITLLLCAVFWPERRRVPLGHPESTQSFSI